MGHWRVVALAFTGLMLATVTAGCSGAEESAAGNWGTDGRGEPHLILAADGSLSGSDGCNRIFGTWTQEGADLTLGPLGSTMMYCEGVDTWLVNAVGAKLEGGFLRITDATGAEIGTLTRGD